MNSKYSKSIFDYGDEVLIEYIKFSKFDFLEKYNNTDDEYKSIEKWLISLGTDYYIEIKDEFNLFVYDTDYFIKFNIISKATNKIIYKGVHNIHEEVKTLYDCNEYQEVPLSIQLQAIKEIKESYIHLLNQPKLNDLSPTLQIIIKYLEESTNGMLYVDDNYPEIIDSLDTLEKEIIKYDLPIEFTGDTEFTVYTGLLTLINLNELL